MEINNPSIDRAQVRAYLAAEMWVPCGKCEDGIHYIVRGDYELSCGTCQGSGKQFPLRKACSQCQGRREYIDFNSRIPAMMDCTLCAGLGYLFNDSADALWDAVEAKGWDISIHAYAKHGTEVAIFYYDQGVRQYRPGTALIGGGKDGDEGLRGHTAMEVGVARALGWKGE